MRITIAQLHVTPDPAENKAKIMAVLRDAEPGDWVAFPEGVLSGYFPQDDSFLTGLEPEKLSAATAEIVAEVRRRRCHCLFGTALLDRGNWYNAVILAGPAGEIGTYRKIELSELDKAHYTAGDEVPTYSVSGTAVGVQVCRELLFPAPWARLKASGARVVFHINNAVNPYDSVWKHVVITRAVENGYVVCSVNNAASPQELTSYLVGPGGDVLLEAKRQTEQVLTGEVDLTEYRSPY